MPIRACAMHDEGMGSDLAAGALGIHNPRITANALDVQQPGAAATGAHGVQSLVSNAAGARGVQLGARWAAAARHVHHARVAALVSRAHHTAGAPGGHLRKLQTNMIAITGTQNATIKAVVG